MSYRFSSIASAADAAAALEGLVLASRDQLFTALMEMLAGLESRALHPRVQLQIAEVLRTRSDDVIGGYRTIYTDRPLPLSDEEAQRFERAMSLLAMFESLYRRAFDLARALPSGDPARSDMPGSLQRSMACVVGQMIEHYRARQNVAPGLWQSLQRHMQAANAEKIEAIQIPDPLNPGGAATPLATYSRALLLSIAQAGAMTARSLEATLALTGLFAHLVETVMLDGANGGETEAASTALGIQRTGRIRVVTVGGITHLVNTTKIATSLNWCMKRLGDGETPEKIGLAAVSQADLTALLPRLHRIWCGAGEIRESAREPLRELSHVAVGLVQVHRFSCPVPLVEPKEFVIYKSGKELEEAAKAIAERAAEVVPAEDWQILDRSASGIRAMRAQAGSRLRRGQIIGIDLSRVRDTRALLLAEVRWLQQFSEREGGGIAAGVRFLATYAQPALVRTFALVRERYQDVAPAFVLDRAGPLQLVVPSGWFSRGRKLDLWYQQRLSRLEITSLVAHGADWELVSCDPAS